MPCQIEEFLNSYKLVGKEFSYIENLNIDN